jgi:hypothetical protein
LNTAAEGGRRGNFHVPAVTHITSSHQSLAPITCSISLQKVGKHISFMCHEARLQVSAEDITHVCDVILPEIQREKVYCASQFWRFQSMIN